MTDTRRRKAQKGCGVVSFRNKPHLAEMMEKIKKQRKRKQSDIIRECLAAHLPTMFKGKNADD